MYRIKLQYIWIRKDVTNMLKILKNLSVYKWIVIGIVALIFTQAMTELLLPTLMGNIVDNGVVEGDIPYIRKFGAVMLLVAGVAVAVAVVSRCLSMSDER